MATWHCRCCLQIYDDTSVAGTDATVDRYLLRRRRLRRTLANAQEAKGPRTPARAPLLTGACGRAPVPACRPPRPAHTAHSE